MAKLQGGGGDTQGAGGWCWWPNGEDRRFADRVRDHTDGRTFDRPAAVRMVHRLSSIVYFPSTIVSNCPSATTSEYPSAPANSTPNVSALATTRWCCSMVSARPVSCGDTSPPPCPWAR